MAQTFLTQTSPVIPNLRVPSQNVLCAMPLKAVYSHTIPLLKLNDRLPDYVFLFSFNKYFPITFQVIKDSWPLHGKSP